MPTNFCVSLVFLMCSLVTAQDAQEPSPPPESAQQPAFRWVDFHSGKDHDVIVWVTRALAVEKWTAIREIGVMYDAALVETVDRATPQASPDADTFQVWSVSLTTHAHAPLISGVKLHWLDWMHFREGEPQEMAILYDDCAQCSATTYFTTFHYDAQQHGFQPRWMRGGKAAPVWSSVAPQGVTQTQIYATLTDLSGQQLLATWTHYDYGKQRPAQDYLFRYDIDFSSGLERTLILSGKDVDSMMPRICSAQAGNGVLARGQDSQLCQELLHPHNERKPTLTPPANNLGRSSPPAARK